MCVFVNYPPWCKSIPIRAHHNASLLCPHSSLEEGDVGIFLGHVSLQIKLITNTSVPRSFNF